MLLKFEVAKEKIKSGKCLALAGDEKLLARLPRGNWIGGTIPYFMDINGGITTKEMIFVQELSCTTKNLKIQFYSENELHNVPVDSPDNGYSIVIVPSGSNAHLKYAQEAPNYPELFFKQIIGWVSGIHLEDIGKEIPKVYNGLTGESSSDKMIALHAFLPANKRASIGILNIFAQGEGDVITFEKEGFSASECLVNGKKRNFADYLTETKTDLRFPLVADYSGTMVNISFQNIDETNKSVNFYAPVFANVTYKLAKPVADYVGEFEKILPAEFNSLDFSCNCILNYLHSNLEGKKTGNITGPITFGEIAYQLLNQTLVYLEIFDN
jgi:hypothetical protein